MKKKKEKEEIDSWKKPTQEKGAEDEGHLGFSRYRYRDDPGSCLDPVNLLFWSLSGIDIGLIQRSGRSKINSY